MIQLNIWHSYKIHPKYKRAFLGTTDDASLFGLLVNTDLCGQFQTLNVQVPVRGGQGRWRYLSNPSFLSTELSGTLWFISGYLSASLLTVAAYLLAAR